MEAEKRLVQQCLGDETAAVEFIDAGWDSRVYSVPSHQAIFKFPRSEKIQGRYPSQIEALKLAASIAGPVSTPQVKWVAPDFAYFGYLGVEGEPLQTVLVGLDADEKQRVGTVLGDFLRDFHKQHLDSARDLGPEKEIEQFQRWYGMGREQCQPLFSADEHDQLNTLVYEIWPAQIRELGNNVVLSHGDFHFDNILYGADGQVGIIDFGDICMADESKDFTGFDDPAMFDAALRAYGQDNDHFRQKVRLRQDVTKVIALTARLAKDEPAKIQETVEQLKRIIRESRQ